VQVNDAKEGDDATRVFVIWNAEATDAAPTIAAVAEIGEILMM